MAVRVAPLGAVALGARLRARAVRRRTDPRVRPVTVRSVLPVSATTVPSGLPASVVTAPTVPPGTARRPVIVVHRAAPPPIGRVVRGIGAIRRVMTVRLVRSDRAPDGRSAPSPQSAALGPSDRATIVARGPTRARRTRRRGRVSAAGSVHRGTGDLRSVAPMRAVRRHDLLVTRTTVRAPTAGRVMLLIARGPTAPVETAANVPRARPIDRTSPRTGAHAARATTGDEPGRGSVRRPGTVLEADSAPAQARATTVRAVRSTTAVRRRVGRSRAATSGRDRPLRAATVCRVGPSTTVTTGRPGRSRTGPALPAANVRHVRDLARLNDVRGTATRARVATAHLARAIARATTRAHGDPSALLTTAARVPWARGRRTAARGRGIVPAPGPSGPVRDLRRGRSGRASTRTAARHGRRVRPGPAPTGRRVSVRSGPANARSVLRVTGRSGPRVIAGLAPGPTARTARTPTRGSATTSTVRRGRRSPSASPRRTSRTTSCSPTSTARSGRGCAP
jgi:hypothetical protein